jgi:hypothetical protein
MTVPFPSLDDRPIYVSLFGTGFRSNDPLQVTATVDGVPVPIQYGPQETPGVDQISIRMTP